MNLPGPLGTDGLANRCITALPRLQFPKGIAFQYGARGIRTPGTFRHACFQDRYFRPLRHRSMVRDYSISFFIILSIEKCRNFRLSYRLFTADGRPAQEKCTLFFRPFCIILLLWQCKGKPKHRPFFFRKYEQECLFLTRILLCKLPCLCVRLCGQNCSPRKPLLSAACNFQGV